MNLSTLLQSLQPGLYDGSTGETLYATKASQGFAGFFADQGYQDYSSAFQSPPNTAYGLVQLDENGAIDYPNSTSQLADNYANIYYGNGSLLADNYGALYYRNGNVLADADDNLYNGNGNLLADGAANLYYGNGNLLADGNTNIYYGNGNLLADGGGNLYYGNGRCLVDGGGNLYYGNGNLLADGDGSLYSGYSIQSGGIMVSGNPITILGDVGSSPGNVVTGAGWLPCNIETNSGVQLAYIPYYQ